MKPELMAAMNEQIKNAMAREPKPNTLEYFNWQEEMNRLVEQQAKLKDGIEIIPDEVVANFPSVEAAIAWMKLIGAW